jgi:membrane-associated phospholipid phosphatase
LRGRPVGGVLTTAKIRDGTQMRRRSLAWPLAVVAVIAIAVFVALTVVVTTNPSLTLDSRAFHIVNDLRAPWIDHAARIITALGLIAIVGPVVLLAAALLIRRRHRACAVALAAGAALAWISVWIVKTAVHRARPPGPLVHTSGQSYPSAHAANSIGWLALAIALTVAIPTRGGRITAIAAGALLAALVGLSRIYLRAHYASDVLAGEALATAMYALAAIGSLARQAPRQSAVGAEATASPPTSVT